MKWIVILSVSFLLQCKTAGHLNVQKQSLSETQDPYLKVAQDLQLAFQNYTQSNPPNDTDHQTLNRLADNINNTPIETITSVIQNPDLAKICDQICQKKAQKKQNQNILSITMVTVSLVFILIYVLADTKYTSDKAEFDKKFIEFQELYEKTKKYRKDAVKNVGADTSIPYLKEVFGDKFEKYHDVMLQARSRADDKIPDELLAPGREDEHKKTFNTLVNNEIRNSLQNDPEMLRKFELFVIHHPEVPKLYKYVSIVAPIVALGSAITSATSILGLTDDSRESKLQHDLEIINNELTQLIMTYPK